MRAMLCDFMKKFVFLDPKEEFDEDPEMPGKASDLAQERLKNEKHEKGWQKLNEVLNGIQ